MNEETQRVQALEKAAGEAYRLLVCERADREIRRCGGDGLREIGMDLAAYRRTVEELLVSALSPRPEGVEEIEEPKAEARESVEPKTSESAKTSARKRCDTCGEPKEPRAFHGAKSTSCRKCVLARRSGAPGSPDTENGGAPKSGIPATDAPGSNGKAESVATRYCQNGEECVSRSSLGHPAKLSSSNPDSECYSCQEAATKAAIGTGEGT